MSSSLLKYSWLFFKAFRCVLAIGFAVISCLTSKSILPSDRYKHAIQNRTTNIQWLIILESLKTFRVGSVGISSERALKLVRKRFCMISSTSNPRLLSTWSWKISTQVYLEFKILFFADICRILRSSLRNRTFLKYLVWALAFCSVPVWHFWYIKNE